MTSWLVVLHHGFLHGIAHLDAAKLRERALALGGSLRSAEQRLSRQRLLVHPDVRTVDTGKGSFLSWGNRLRADPVFQPMVEIMLRMTSGPWVTDLPTDAWPGAVVPALDDVEAWFEETVRKLLGHGLAYTGDRAGILALHLETLDQRADGTARYRGPVGDACVRYWRRLAALDDELCRDDSRRTTLQILEEAAQQVGPQIVILDSARRSAARWDLDCAGHELHRAILGLAVYARALTQCKDDGSRLGREEAADVYHKETTIPMSREGGNLGPSRKQERSFVAGPHGRQFFDMHAKPGNLTRIHVWVTAEQEGGSIIQRIYIGHCGRHLS